MSVVAGIAIAAILLPGAFVAAAWVVRSRSGNEPGSVVEGVRANLALLAIAAVLDAAVSAAAVLVLY